VGRAGAIARPASFGLFAVAKLRRQSLCAGERNGAGGGFRAPADGREPRFDALFSYQLLWAGLLTLLLAPLLPLSMWLVGWGDLALVAGALALAFFFISLRTVPSIIAQRKLAYGSIVAADIASQIAYWAGGYRQPHQWDWARKRGRRCACVQH